MLAPVCCNSLSPVMPCSKFISLRLLSKDVPLPFPCGLRQPDGVMCQTIRSLSPILLSHTRTDTRPGNKITIFPFQVRFEPKMSKSTTWISSSSVLTLDASPCGEAKQTCGKLPQSFASFPGIGVYTPLWYMALHRVLIPPCRTPLRLQLQSLSSERMIRFPLTLLSSPREPMMNLL
jgi:hypothetical protein